MKINQLPIKVFVSSIHNQTLGKMTVVDLLVDPDCSIAILPNARRIELTVSDSSFEKTQFTGGSSIKTWKQALAFFQKMEERHQPFWVEISDTEIESVEPAEDGRMLNPKLCYNLKVGSFRVLE
ncbi:MAG: hypothetical protein WC505_01375 [Patescibacteria group bacterium]